MPATPTRLASGDRLVEARVLSTSVFPRPKSRVGLTARAGTTWMCIRRFHPGSGDARKRRALPLNGPVSPDDRAHR